MRACQMKRRSTASKSATFLLAAPDYRKNDRRYHGDAAYPDDYSEDMNRSGNRDVIHGEHRLVSCTAKERDLLSEPWNGVGHEARRACSPRRPTRRLKVLVGSSPFWSTRFRQFP